MFTSLVQYLFTAVMAVAHPFFVSVTEISHNASEKSLEISCKLFTDDFEKALRKNNNTKIDLTRPADRSAMDKAISAYIRQHLQVKADGKVFTLQYIGYELEEEAAWCYFEVKGVNTLRRLDISNALLYDYVDKQSNIMHVTVGGERQTKKVEFPKKEVEFVF
jgi:hypothetical protein